MRNVNSFSFETLLLSRRRMSGWRIVKRLLLAALVFSSLFSCQIGNAGEGEEEVNQSQLSKPAKVDSIPETPKYIDSTTERVENSTFIQDSSDYSISFLNAMTESGMIGVSIVDSFLILGPTDTVVFPQIPVVGSKTTLTAVKDELAITLTVERINQTSIDYQIEMVEAGNTSYTYKGQADLHPRFYFGSESDESSISGISYGVTEFRDDKDSCYTVIRLGMEDESGPYLLGKIIKNCNGKLRGIDLDNFPTLLEK